MQYTLKRASNADFTDFLSAFKWVFNNNINAFTEQISNEIIYRFNLTNFFDVIADSNAKKFETECKIHQQEVQDSIAWTNFIIKNCYNKCHISLLLNFKDLVILKLHYEYHVSDVKNKKLFIQQVNCFFVKWWVSLLVYELKLSTNMKIHSIMSVINFESVSSRKNLYNWLYDDHLLFMKENHDIDDEWKSFYIEKLFDCHFYHYKHNKQIIESLIKWTDYRLEFNK